MKGKLAKLSLLLGVMVLIAVIIALYFPQPAPPPVKALPNPNGYDSLVKAGRALTGSPADLDKMTLEALQQLVTANTSALQLARSGLALECQVPVQYTPAYDSAHMAGLGNFKRLAQTFAAEGRLAELENRLQDSARSHLDTIHLGIASTKGGLLIDALVGVAVEKIGVRQLENLTARLDANSCREAVATLEKFETQRQPWKEIIEQEHRWMRRREVTFRERLGGLLMSGSIKKVEAGAETKFNENLTRTRRLSIHLAARAYELEKSQKPKIVADLIPEFLKVAPQDPITGTNLPLHP